MLKAYTWFLVHLRNERGEDLIEYAMLGGLIASAMVAVVALGVLTGGVELLFDGVSKCVDFDPTSPCP